ncbi:hypothetical protein T552_01168 [Pneumocystis carinii B80]|uniref:SCA7 domain-containing protein n=1 Tax=Pneumocystis carinii (strain B80) TaxID=1408658 RepID=A0A0W4ZLG7_PNEC8|nr:hypothetical protein T552_01168 [Pneumocystis carinii B80]KTW29212.1 hypothetical protein T552_01168 [Pneumocystis carinii B80]
MDDKETEEERWSSVVSLLFCEKSLSLFNEKEKERRVKLEDMNEKNEEKEVGWVEIAEELNRREPLISPERLSCPGSPITTILEVDDYEKYGYNPLSEAMKYIHCKNCGRVVLQNVFYKHAKVCNQSQDVSSSTSREVYEKTMVELQNVSMKRSKKRQHSDEDSDTSTVNDANKSLKVEKYDYKDKNELKKLKSKNILIKQKASIDLEKQCGVLLPNGNLCSRSLTCKSHSMSAKRSVPGRSRPYDILLVHYQKKNKIKQQKAATMSSFVFDDYASDARQVDSDEEVTLVMESILCSTPSPLERKVMVPVRKKRRFFRFQEMLSVALCQGQWPGKIQGSVTGILGRVIPFHVNSDWKTDENTQSSL